MRAVVVGPGGIGGAVVRELAAQGHEVVVGWHRSEDAVPAEAKAAFPVDVTDPASCKDFVATVGRALGPFTALVNCFGTLEEGPLLRTGPDAVRRLVDLNVTGVVNMCRAATFRLMKSGGGTIVNIGSAVSQVGMPGLSAYAASKGALVSFGRGLAAELAPYRVTCNTVLPGFIDSGPTAARPERAREVIARHVPLGRLGTPDEVAALVGYLVSPAAAYLTGQEFVIDGGWTLGTAALTRELREVVVDG